MGGVGTSILGRPRNLPRDRRASHHPTSDYTLNCEEPRILNVNAAVKCQITLGGHHGRSGMAAEGGAGPPRHRPWPARRGPGSAVEDEWLTVGSCAAAGCRTFALDRRASRPISTTSPRAVAASRPSFSSSATNAATVGRSSVAGRSCRSHQARKARTPVAYSRTVPAALRSARR